MGVIGEGSLAGLGPDLLLPISIEIVSDGTLDATVDWKFATNDVETARPRNPSASRRA